MTGKTILVVENDRLVAEALKDDLVAMECAVLGPALNCSEALSLMAGARPDLAFVAAQLGDETGEAVASECRRQGIPVVICSAHDATNLPEHAFGMPAMRKPYSREDVANFLRWRG